VTLRASSLRSSGTRGVAPRQWDKSDYVGPNKSVATGTQESVTIVAFNLGTCDGKFMHQAVEWFFPQHGETFDPNQYENICTGSYYPASS